MKRQLGNQLVFLAFLLSVIIGCSETPPQGTSTGSPAVQSGQNSLGSGSGGAIDMGGGAGPAGPAQSAGSAPSTLSAGLNQASTAIGSAQSAMQNAGTTFTPDQLQNISNVQSDVGKLADFYKSLPVNSTPQTVLDWLQRRDAYYAQLRELAQTAQDLNLQWLADIVNELGNRVDIMRFYSPTQRKSAFVAKPADAQSFVNLAASNGYYFTGIAMQMWGKQINVHGVNASVAIYQCYSPGWKLWFPHNNADCVNSGNVNTGIMGYVSATRSVRATTPIYRLVNTTVQDIIVTRNVAEAIALIAAFQYTYVDKMGYVP